MKSVNEIIRDVVNSTSARYGKNISYMFGDWEYVSDELTKWGKLQKTGKLKFPIVCLYSPFTEDRSISKYSSVNLNLIIMTNTRKDYTNEEREKLSFENILRPIYGLFMDSLYMSQYVDKPYGMGKSFQHDYTENYRYGRTGVKGGDGKPFSDFIDAIEISNLSLTIKNIECNAKRI